jgi:hypothetical protein
MGKRVFSLGLLVILAACGGHVDPTSGDDESLPLPRRNEEQGLYQPGKTGPEHVADGLGSPSAIVMTEDRVVFTTRSTTLAGEHVAAGALYVSDKRTGPALMISVDRQGASFDALATDGTTAFVATSNGRILSVPVAGGATKQVAKLDAAAISLTASGEYVYFATNAGALARVAKKGGEVEPLATITGAIRGLDADDAAVYVATGSVRRSTSEETPAGIVRVPLDGSAVRVLTSGKEPCAMIRDGRRLFWTSLAAPAADPAKPDSNGEVLRLSVDGGDVATVVSGAFAACAIAADKDSLYFATTVNAMPVKSGGAAGTRGALGLMRAPISGGEPVAVADATQALSQPGAVAVDATHVYWLTGTAVLRLPKK